MESYTALPDDELWKLLDGPERRMVLSVLYRRYYELLYNYGLKCVADEELVKDCIQDVFVKLHQGKALALHVTVRAYLLRAFHNAFLDQTARLGLRQDIFLEETLPIPDTADFFEETFALTDEDLRRAKALRDALRMLPAHQRRVLYLHYVRRLSYKEIAAALDISVQSSMNLNNRALTKLRSLLSGEAFAWFLALSPQALVACGTFFV